MLNQIFQGVFSEGMGQAVAVSEFLLCVVCALAAGLVLAGMYAYRSRYSKSFLMTLALLPAIVCAVILMVNGNVGTGVAVAGTFSLVRFRSVPGTAKEIGALFLAMGTGLIFGMGYPGLAFLFVLILGTVMMLYSRLDFGVKRNGARDETLRVTIPEDLNYTEVFDGILDRYAGEWELLSVKTTNLGSLFKLTYQISLRTAGSEKELIDELRCHNGNLEIMVSRREDCGAEL